MEKPGNIKAYALVINSTLSPWNEVIRLMSGM